MTFRLFFWLFELLETDLAIIVILCNYVEQWFSNCASRRPGVSFQFSKGVAGYFGFVPLGLVVIASKEL